MSKFMGNLGDAAKELRDIAAKAGSTIDIATNLFAACAERQDEINATRRSSDSDREAIDAYMNSLNGNISADMPISEIVAGAGVPKKQGTSSYAKQALKRALIAYQK